MRIGGGIANRRVLRTVEGLRTRPTSGRVRQALFNVLRGQVEDGIFIDLFAGTGSVGLEALSHGAQQVYFVENDFRALRVLQANIQHCAMARQTTVVSGTLPRALKKLPANLRADVLFLDPPYASNLGEETLMALENFRLLIPQRALIWQHEARRVVPPVVLGLPLRQSRRYGDTRLSLYMAQTLNDRSERSPASAAAIDLNICVCGERNGG